MSREMKDSGIEWIGEIPKEWKIRNIDSCYRLRNKKVSDKEYQPLSVTKNGVVPQLETAAKTDAHDDRKLVKENDFVINSRSDRRGSCGISKYDGSVSLINTVLESRFNSYSPYYDWLFHTIQFGDEFYKWGHGIVDDLWTTNWNDMRKISIPYPSKEEQTRIADYLDSKCSQIDSLVSNIEAQISKLDEYRQVLITQAVTKGLDPNAEMKDSGVEWIGEIPKGWEVTKFKRIAHISPNLVDPRDHQDVNQIGPDSIEKNTGRITINRNVADSGVNSSNHLFHKGMILYSKIRPELNKATIAPFDGLCSADMYPIICSINERFLLFSILSKPFLEQAKNVSQMRVKMPKVNQEEIDEFYITLPPLEEQNVISNSINKMIKTIDDLIDKKNSEIERCIQYKKSLIFDFVTGKKEVPTDFRKEHSHD